MSEETSKRLMRSFGNY